MLSIYSFSILFFVSPLPPLPPVDNDGADSGWVGKGDYGWMGRMDGWMGLAPFFIA
jgi:hypothetical protein